MLIVTEGTKTEVQYLEGLAQFLRSTGVSVRDARRKGVGRDPMGVLSAALELNELDPDGGYDETWLVVDVDEHATLQPALEDARSRSIPVVVSNPCFEIWLLWHYEDCAAHRSPSELARKLRAHGHTDKKVPPGFPFGEYARAEQRASARPVQHSLAGPNPSSSMPVLLRAIQRST
ncbi:RloB family protein [Sinomonas soli]